MTDLTNSKLSDIERVEAKKLSPKGDAILYRMCERPDVKRPIQMMKGVCSIDTSKASSYMLLQSRLHEKSTCHGPVEPPVKMAPQLLRLQPPIGGGQCAGQACGFVAEGSRQVCPAWSGCFSRRTQRQQNLWFTGPANIQHTLLFISYRSCDLAIHLGDAQTLGMERAVVAVGVGLKGATSPPTRPGLMGPIFLTIFLHLSYRSMTSSPP